MHSIGDDLDDHAWYRDLAAELIAAVEAFLARWARFEQVVAEFATDQKRAAPLPPFRSAPSGGSRDAGDDDERDEEAASHRAVVPAPPRLNRRSPRPASPA